MKGHISVNSKIQIKKMESSDYIKYYLTLQLDKLETIEETVAVYSNLCKLIIDSNMKIVYEKVFGRMEYKEAFQRMREQCQRANGLHQRYPSSYIGSKPLSDKMILTGIMIYGIVTKRETQINCIFDNDTAGSVIGTEIRSNDSRYLYLVGLNSDHGNTKNCLEEYNSIYKKIDLYLDKLSYSPKDIVRTWIYLDKINQYYEQFNQVRREYFARNNIDISSNSTELPASTCVGGLIGDSRKCNVDIFCIDKKVNKNKTQRLHNSRQNEAEGNTYLFKPTFSRGMLIQSDDFAEVQISGTASINTSGKTIYLDNPYNQIKCTLLNVKSLLKKVNMDLDNICMSTCFFKKKEYINMFFSVLNELEVEAFPCTFSIGDICRKDLLFEIDGIAAKEYSTKRCF